MAYMKDSKGRRLDTIVVQDRLESIRRNSVLKGTPVANEALWYDAGVSGATVPNGNTKKRHIITADCTNLRLNYANVYNRDEYATVTTITVRASILIGSLNYPVYFAGKRDVVIEPGGFVSSDPIAFDFTAGQVIYTKTFVGGGRWPLQGSPNGMTVTAWGEGCDAANSTSQPDKTMSGTITANNAAGYSPYVLTGEPFATGTRCVGLVGDSIASGLGDYSGAGTAPPDAGRGFVRRALNNTIPYVSIAASGENVRDLHNIRDAVIRGCSSFVVDTGINDVNGAIALATIQLNMLARWTTYARYGAPVYQTTLTPITTSTDVWATTTNQTVTANESLRVSVNTWIRAGAPIDPTTKAAVAVGTSGALTAGNTGHPLAGYFDVADTVETARNSGIWKVGSVYTVDNAGIHPVYTGHGQMAAAIDVTKLI
jgi:lysophospholipase L1-like esterase